MIEKGTAWRFSFNRGLKLWQEIQEVILMRDLHADIVQKVQKMGSQLLSPVTELFTDTRIAPEDILTLNGQGVVHHGEAGRQCLQARLA